MTENKNIHPFCDICGKELLESEIEKNLEHENYEFPICDDCFKEAIDKIVYIINN